MFSIDSLIKSRATQGGKEASSKQTEISSPILPDLIVADISYVSSVVPDDSEGQAAALESKRIMESAKMSILYKDSFKSASEVDSEELLARMESANSGRLAELDVKLEDARTNLGESELRDAYFEKIEFLCGICDFEKALEVLDECDQKGIVSGSALSRRLDTVIYRIRIKLFQWPKGNAKELVQLLEKGKQMLEGAGDWDQKTRLKVYEAIILFTVKRDFTGAVNLFLETISTYSCYEVLEFNRFVHYTVLLAMISLDRPDLKNRVIMNSEVKQVLYSNPTLTGFIQSLYECDYAKFFRHLATVERALKLDRYFGIHYRYYVREMRVKAYEQQLISYSSLGLTAFANAFGVSEQFIDRELSRLISSKRLNCKLNRVEGLVNTTRPDTKNKAYGELVKKGDELLTRLQKLSRVINL